MTPDYLKMMWKRIDFLRYVLELGYNFIFTVNFQLGTIFIKTKLTARRNMLSAYFDLSV